MLAPRPRVLIVDDDPSLRKTTQLILENSGYDVATACDGVEALERVGEAPFDVVLMDIRMPRMSGVAAFEALRARGSDAAVVLMTAYAMDDVVDEALMRGAIDVFRKPFDVDRLLAVLSACGRPSRHDEP